MEADKVIKAAKELLAPQFIIFNLCFVYIGMIFSFSVSAYSFALITVAFLSARSSGVIMNRLVGRNADLNNPKKAKSMVSLGIPKKYVALLFVIAASIFLASTYLLNRLSLILAPLVLLFFVIDPVSKLYTSKRHYVLGIIESFDVMGGYIGATGAFPPYPALYVLMLGIIFIGVGLDTMISLVHTDFDRKYGLKTFSSVKGTGTALRYSLYSHIVASALMVIFAALSGSVVIMAGAASAAAVLLYQHARLSMGSDIAIVRRVVGYNTAASAILLVSVAAAYLA